ncbi:MAG: hypothetical protein LUD77_05225 [Clostridiales bacterium]|nr:hypothetical protein [Clostridiales bacterium]
MLKKTLLVIAAAVAVIFVILLNDIDFVPLINSEGKTYAKAEVTEILRDNLIEDGTRVGR